MQFPRSVVMNFNGSLEGVVVVSTEVFLLVLLIYGMCSCYSLYVQFFPLATVIIKLLYCMFINFSKDCLVSVIARKCLYIDDRI
jgi:hypothetical protein